VTSENHLRVQTNLGDLNQVLQWFEQLNQSSIPRKVWIQCKTALAEGFTNAVRHAHQDFPIETPIDIEVSITPEQLEIRIWDLGAAFDLTQKLESQSQINDLDAFSGRGLYLIRQLVNHFSYTRLADDRNCLLMVKYYSAA
jgi:serine/threonine-protein kinase RsbW